FRLLFARPANLIDDRWRLARSGDFERGAFAALRDIEQASGGSRVIGCFDSDVHKIRTLLNFEPEVNRLGCEVSQSDKVSYRVAPRRSAVPRFGAKHCGA